MNWPFLAVLLIRQVIIADEQFQRIGWLGGAPVLGTPGTMNLDPVRLEMA